MNIQFEEQWNPFDHDRNEISPEFGSQIVVVTHKLGVRRYPKYYMEVQPNIEHGTEIGTDDMVDGYTVTLINITTPVEKVVEVKQVDATCTIAHFKECYPPKHLALSIFGTELAQWEDGI